MCNLVLEKKKKESSCFRKFIQTYLYIRYNVDVSKFNSKKKRMA